METFNIWDLDGVNVKIKRGFLDTINIRIFHKFKTKTKAYKFIFNKNEFIYPVFKNMLKLSYLKNNYISLDFLLKVCEALDISREELQKNIISYKAWGSVNFIDNPVLPITINPVFDMIYAHNIGDGTVSIAKGRLPYFAYRQFNEFYRNSYLKKIEYIFGKIVSKKDKFKDFTRVRCPSNLSSLFFKYYNLNDRSFLSDVARLSSKIFEKCKDSMIAVLCAFIIDEGHIDSTQVVIGLKNKLLVEDLKKICDILGYNSIVTFRKGDYHEFVYLYIRREGMKKFYFDYLELNKEYPLIDLGIKGERIEQSFNIVNREIKMKKGNVDMIWNILKKENLSVNQLALRINMTRQGVRYHIHNLLKEQKIRVIDNNQLNWIYGV